MGTGGRRHTWFVDTGGREISRHIMFGLILQKNWQNEKQAHKTWTKRRTNYAYRLAKANRNEQYQKTRPNDKNRHVQFLAETQQQQIRSSDWTKKD